MAEIDQFVKQNTHWLFAVWAVLFVVMLAWRWHQYQERGVTFPDIDPISIRYRETSASGCSHKSVWTRLGGASNCLTVTVTDSEVWIRSWFLLEVLAGHQFDLIHRIPRTSFTAARRKSPDSPRNVILEFRDTQGEPHRIELILRKGDEFLRVLGATPAP
jgi:hypothetical protein